MRSNKSLIRKYVPQSLQEFLSLVHTHLYTINNSKIFAGFVVVMINITSRFVDLNISKGLEFYLKKTLNRNILIFCVAWMGSRDIYLAMTVMCLFSLFADFLFNENSYWCLYPETFANFKSEALLNQEAKEKDKEKEKETATNIRDQSSQSIDR